MPNRVMVWFRADLRMEDNPALSEALETSDDGVIGVFLYHPAQWRSHDWGQRRVAWVHRHVTSLRADLAARGIPLMLRVCPWFSDAPETLAALAAEYNCDGIYWNKEYELNECRRDEAVKAHCSSMTLKDFDDQVLLPPGDVKTLNDDWYKVFTPFKKRLIAILEERGGPSPPIALPTEEYPRLLDEYPSDPLPTTLEGYDLSDAIDTWEAGETEAQRRMDTFLEDGIERYHELRDIPGVDGTSSLSAYMAVGAISTRQCVDAVLEYKRTSDERAGNWSDIAWAKDGPATWISELIWREFNRHLLIAFPRLCMYKPFQLHTEALEWRDAEEDYEAWCDGRTGYPIVDAAMHQLKETGWMHNRLRMVTAMFLTKHLLIDWRKGERWFMSQLLDGDLANNNGGWQWAASTGTDAAPYFRIFNPWSQGKRFDAKGEFIKRYLPELQDLPAAALHDPKKLAKVKPANYPDPICIHSVVRLRAIDAFKQLKRSA